MIATLQHHSKTSLFALAQHNDIVQTIYHKLKPLFDLLSLALIAFLAMVYGLTTGFKIAYQILSSTHAIRAYQQTWCIIVHTFYFLKSEYPYALQCWALVLDQTRFFARDIFQTWCCKSVSEHVDNQTPELQANHTAIDPFSPSYMLATKNDDLSALQRHTAKYIDNGNYNARLVIEAWDELKQTIRINGKDGLVIPIETIAGLALSISIANGYCSAITDKTELAALLRLCDSSLTTVENQHDTMRNQWYSLTPIEKRWKKRNGSNDPSHKARSRELVDRLREHTIGEDFDTDTSLPAFENIMNYAEFEYQDNDGNAVDYHTYVSQPVPF